MVTIFKNFNEVVEHKTIPTILEEIKTGKYLHAIVYLRKSLLENKLEAYNKAKKSLPAFTPSGKFIDGRKVELLAEYSNFMILDIDKLEPEALHKAIEMVKNCEFTYASFISPSGNGLKILVKTDNLKTEHKETFLLIQSHYEALLKLEIDKSGKDISRLCFYSHDENLYLNEDSKVFQNENEIEVIAPIEVCSPLLGRGAGGEDWDLIYNHCIKFTEKKVQFIDGSRNVFVHQLACNLNRKAMPLDQALNFILTDFGFDEKEVKQAVNSAYGNIHEFGTNNNKTTQNETKKKKSKELLEDEDDDDDDKPRPTQIAMLRKKLI